MKMMKVSNQLCSTMRKQVFRRIHQDLPSPSSMLTWQHLNRWTQPGTSVRGGQTVETCPTQTCPLLHLPGPSTQQEGQWLNLNIWFRNGDSGRAEAILQRLTGQGLLESGGRHSHNRRGLSMAEFGLMPKVDRQKRSWRRETYMSDLSKGNSTNFLQNGGLGT